jgi:Flp pilus assembly protein TadD
MFQFHSNRKTPVAMVFALALAGCQSAPSGNAAVPGDVLNVADAAIAAGNPGMALSISQAALAQTPGSPQALYHEAAAYYAMGRCEDAMAAYRVALKQNPHAAEAETGVGRCLLRRNAIEAEQAFAAAVADDPGNAAALNDLGIARDLEGHFADATVPYQQALLLAPGTLATEVNLGLSLALAGNAGDALQYLGPLAASQQATPRIRADYAVALVAAGRLDEARAVLATDLPPDKVEADLDAFTNVTAHGPGAAAQAMVLLGYIPPG